MKWLFMLLGVLCNPVLGVEFTYQEVTANTPPTRFCYPQIKATDITADRYNLDHFSKRLCSALGAGWFLNKRKEQGVPVCTPCSGNDAGKHQCFMEKVVVSCKIFKVTP